MIVRHGAVRRRSGFPYEMPTAPPWNAPTFCEVPTYDNTGAFVHFSIVDMHREVGHDWHGWRYWGSLTPYFQGNDDVENPSIVVSSDGFHWVVPNGVQNPIYPEPTLGLNMWNADSDIAYDPKSDALVMTFQGEREGLVAQDQVFAISPDGTHWPMRASSGGLETMYQRCASASIFRDTDGTWLMYAVYTGGGGAVGIRTLMRWRSDNPCGPWHSREDLVISEEEMNVWGGPWHVEALLDTEGVYRLLVWSGWTRQYVYPCSSTDGLSWSVGDVLLRAGQYEPSLADDMDRWDRNELYRGSFLDLGDRFRVYYAGHGPDDWRLGCVDVPRSVFPNPPLP